MLLHQGMSLQTATQQPGSYTEQHSGSPVDVHGVLLAYSVGPGHGLKVVLGVPVAVKDDHGISGGQVDAQPPCSGGQQEGKVPGPRGIKVLHGLQQKGERLGFIERRRGGGGGVEEGGKTLCMGGVGLRHSPG